MRVPFFTRSGGKVVAVADIGGGGVSVALVRINDSGPSEILLSASAHTPLEERAANQSIAALAQAVQEVSASLLKVASEARLAPARELFAIVHAPWVRSKTLVAQRGFDKETRITDALVGELAKEALATAGVARDDLFEAHVSHIELNGYTVHAPAGQQAHHIKVVALAGEMERAQRDALAAPLEAAFPGVQIRWRSQVRAMSTLLHESSEGRNAVVVDVADDGASITVMRKQELTASVVVPVGLQSILTQLSPQGSREETLALMSMLESGTCSSAECERIGSALGQAQAVITKTLGEPLGNLAAQRKLPNDLFVLAHADVAAWLARFFARLDFAQFTVTSKPFATHPLCSDDFSRFVKLAAGARADASVCMAVALVHTEQQER